MQRCPDGLVDCVEGAAVFAGEGGGQVGLVDGARGGGGRDVAGEGGAGGGRLEGVVKVVEVG